MMEVGDHQQVLDYAIRQTTRTSPIGEFLNRLVIYIEKILLGPCPLSVLKERKKGNSGAR